MTRSLRSLTTFAIAVPLASLLLSGCHVTEDDHGDHKNVSMNFGPFHLGVRAADFQSSDSPDKVIAFYQKDLASRYGSVIECRGHSSVGSVTHTSQGLTCSDDEHTHIKTSDGHSKGLAIMSEDSATDIELRSGSPQHLHVWIGKIPQSPAPSRSCTVGCPTNPIESAP